MSSTSEAVRLEAQTRELTAKIREADRRGDREQWLKLNKAWVAVMRRRLA